MANLKDVDLEGQGGTTAKGAHTLAGRANGLKQPAPANPVPPWGLPPSGSQTLATMTLKSPPPWGLLQSSPDLAGTASLISKTIPAPEQPQGAGRSSLHLKGGHHALALEKARKLGCLGGELGRGIQFGGFREDASSLIPSLPTPGSVPSGHPLRALTGIALGQPCGSGWPSPHLPAVSWLPGTAGWPEPTPPGHPDRRPPSPA